jgi:hypothetical protein
MKTFTEFNNDVVNEHVYAILEMMILMEMDVDDLNRLDEIAVINKNVEKLNPYLNKLGLKLAYKKTLIQHAIDAGVGVVKMLRAGMAGDKEEVLRLAKSVKKEDIANFLLRLDKATLNVIGGTIGRIEAITGWRLTAAPVAKMAANAVDIVKKAFKLIHDHLPKIPTYKKGDRKKIKEIEKAIV